MPKTIRLYGIKWDTSSDWGSYAKGPSAKLLDLPSEVVVTVNRRWDPETEAADHLSENYGFCVLGCSWEEIKK
jgi:ribosome biogenesis protein Tsr3